MSLRLPPTTHSQSDKGFLSAAIAAAKKYAKSAYISNGEKRMAYRSSSGCSSSLSTLPWKKPSSGILLHCIHEEGVKWKNIAGLIGKRLNLPIVSLQAGKEAMAHFGFLASFVAVNNPISSKSTTQERFDWKPNGPGRFS